MKIETKNVGVEECSWKEFGHFENLHNIIWNWQTVRWNPLNDKQSRMELKIQKFSSKSDQKAKLLHI